jgi:adenosylhomocysteinase
MEGFRVVTMDYAADKADIFVTATGNLSVITHDHMRRMKNNAIVCNIGHFDSEIEIAALKQYKWDNIKPQVDHVVFPDGKRLIVLAEGPPRKPRLRHRPSFVRDVEFVHQPDPRTARAVHQGRPVREQGLRAAQAAGREGRTPALKKLGVDLTVLNENQCKYLSVPIDGPLQVGSLPVLRGKRTDMNGAPLAPERRPVDPSSW